MEKAAHIFKKILLLGVLFVLFLPLLQNSYNFFKVRDLKGSFMASPDINFTPQYWWEGIFQQNKEVYLSENFGLHNTFIRLINQAKFNLFRTTNSAEVVIGKDGYLFAQAYIDAYTGKDFIGVDKIVAKSRAIKQLQDKLLARGKVFLPVIAPNKARALHQFLPDGTGILGLSNYEAYVQCFKKLDVHYLDFSDYFVKNYQQSPHPLFSKYGVHWSIYGYSFAADSMIHYLNSVYGLKTPQMIWKEQILQSDSLVGMDYDAGDNLNLFVRQLPSEKMAYPRYRIADTLNPKPPVLVVGDSYNFGFETTPIYDKVFSDYKFLYYLREIHPYPEDKDAFLKLRLKQELDSHQVFLLIATEHNLKNFGWGFIEKALNIENGKKDDILDDYTRDELLQESAIYKDKVWLADLQRKAFETNQSLDVLVTDAATFITDKKYGRTGEEDPLKGMIRLIRSDQSWMREINKRAKEKHISVDSAIVIDARWQLEHNK